MLQPSIYALRRLLRRKTLPFALAAAKSWEISPSEDFISQPALSLPGQWEKMQKLEPHTFISNEILRIFGGKVVHSATQAFQFENVLIYQGSLYTNNWGMRIDPFQKLSFFPLVQSLFLQNVPSIEEAFLSSTTLGNKFFGHWLLDDCTLSLAGIDLSLPLLSVHSQDLSPHQKRYQELFEIDWRRVPLTLVDKLTILDDIGQNAYKRERYQKLRRKIKTHISNPKPPFGVFFQRSGGQARNLINQDEIVKALETYGFAIANPSMSVDEILNVCIGAQYIIGIDGSHLSHGVLAAPDNAWIISIVPPTRFLNVYKDYCDAIGLRYAFMVADVVPGGFKQNIDDLLKTIDLTQKKRL